VHLDAKDEVAEARFATDLSRRMQRRWPEVWTAMAERGMLMSVVWAQRTWLVSSVAGELRRPGEGVVRRLRASRWWKLSTTE